MKMSQPTYVQNGLEVFSHCQSDAWIETCMEDAENQSIQQQQ